MSRRPIIAGNWKMNKGTSHAGAEMAALLLEAIEAGIAGDPAAVDVVVCPPYTAIFAVRAAFGVASGVAVGAQDAFWKASGAYTGQISPEMLAAEGATFVILGHSETRGRFGVPEPDFTEDVLKVFGETDVTVNRKTKAALGAGLVPIVCVGETRAEREAGGTDSIVAAQIRGALDGISGEQTAGLVFAYEPVWAIGTGLTCEPEEADRVCGVVRSTVASLYGNSVAEAVRVQYGGSMKPDNAADLLARPNIDGGLIGGASLKAADFAAIIAAAATAAAATA